MRRLLALLLVASPTLAWAWDPVGDITHPERIIRNVGREADHAVRDIPNIPRNVAREVGNVGSEIDRMRLEAQVQAAAPAFEAWLNNSRNTARSGGTRPIPPDIRSALVGRYDDDVLARAQFKVGDNGILNLANLSIRYGDASAVTLVDTIIFSNEQSANDPSIWAHELKHIQQFRDWGTRDFAIRYLRSWNSVEGEAYAAQRNFDENFRQANNYQNPPNIVLNRPAFACATPVGLCAMPGPFPQGVACSCPLMQGGFAPGVTQ